MNQTFPSHLIDLGEKAPFLPEILLLKFPKSLVCTHSPCFACCPSVLTLHSLNCFLLLRTTPCNTCGHRQRYLAPVPSPLVHANHSRWHCVSRSTTVCQGMCLCNIRNILHLTSLQIRLGTSKTKPPNTSLVCGRWLTHSRLELLSLTDSDMEVKIKARPKLCVIARMNFQTSSFWSLSKPYVRKYLSTRLPNGRCSTDG